MKTLKLEVGKTYRNRKGEVVRIVEKNNTAEYPFRGRPDEWYTESGRVINLCVAKSEQDLIEEVKEVPETRHTFAIPDGVKEITLDYFGNRLVVEMVPTAGPKPLFDALKKAGKKWNAETMQVEEIPEIDRILEWVEENIKDGYYNQEDVAEAIEGYLKQKEAKK